MAMVKHNSSSLCGSGTPGGADGLGGATDGRIRHCTESGLPRREHAESVKLHPGANVVEVTFDLSTRIVGGNETDLKQITVEIWSPDRNLSLVGFSPSTILQSEARTA